MHLQHRTKAGRTTAAGATLLLLGMTAAGLARADDRPALPSWSLRGFGSAGVAYSDNADADYTSSILKASGVGASGRWSSGLDSRIGAQLTVKLAPRWSAVLQVIDEQNQDKHFQPSVEWANIKYQASADLALRFGRIALPTFIAADYRKIGYAYPWVRPPVEVYGALTLTNSDGVDATYRWHSHGVKHVTQAFLGSTAVRIPSIRMQARRLAGLTHSAEAGAASVRISVVSTELTTDLAAPLFDAMRQFGAQGVTLAERYAVVHKHAVELRIGASYDPGSWFAMGELGGFRSRSLLGRSTSMHASAGYRVGDFTPYVSYARIRADAAAEPGLDLARVAPAQTPAAARLNGELRALLSAIPIQRTVSIGARWDCATDLAVKLQFDRVKPEDGSRGLFVHLQPGFRSGHAINVASAVLDFVF